jgi:hypothetical protein
LNGDFVLVMVVVCDGGGLWGLWWCYCRDDDVIVEMVRMKKKEALAWSLCNSFFLCCFFLISCFGSFCSEKNVCEIPNFSSSDHCKA